MRKFGLIIFVILALALSGCAQQSTSDTPAATPAESYLPTDAPADEAALTPDSGDMLIPLSSLGTEPTFVDRVQDGIAMQIIALIDASGTPRLAYNTCQVCAGSPYAYFDYKDGILLCRNCGNTFSLDSVGRVSGGCNPMPVPEYSSDGVNVIIADSELTRASESFVNWKAEQ